MSKCSQKVFLLRKGLTVKNICCLSFDCGNNFWCLFTLINYYKILSQLARLIHILYVTFWTYFLSPF